jgi:hypothetical protein
MIRIGVEKGKRRCGGEIALTLQPGCWSPQRNGIMVTIGSRCRVVARPRPGVSCAGCFLWRRH